MRRILPAFVAAFLDARRQQAIRGIDRFVGKPISVGDPAFVYRLVATRNNALHGTAQHVRIDIRTNAVVWRDCGALHHFPCTRAVTVWFVIERAYRAQVDDVSRQFVVDILFDVGRNFDVLTA